MKNNKTHLRKCISCQGHFEKKELIRLVREKSGNVLIDLEGKKNGRGAYICKKKDCIERATKNRLFNRALKANPGNELYQELYNYVDER